MRKKRTKRREAAPITEAEVESRIREFFSRNYDHLRQDGGHALAEGAKEQALQQVLHYWRKLKDVATTVTETEVKLSLPGQTTPKRRPFVIEGVVDIVRDGDRVVMYDLKTHEAKDVRAERESYEKQLNVYAHIWRGVRGQRLDQTAIIATRLPAELRDAIRSGDRQAIPAAFEAWKPVVDLPFDDHDVRRTIEDFGRCVDDIEDGNFAPPPPEKLRQPPGTRKQKDHGRQANAREQRPLMFAQLHCQNCDARFGCSSYRAYEKAETRRRSPASMATRHDRNEAELDAWIEQNLADD